MKKIFITFFVLVFLALVAAIGGAPYWFGMETEKAYDAVLQAPANESAATLTPVSYDRGWFSSTVQTKIQYRGIPTVFMATSQVSHGPFPLSRILSDSQFTPVKSQIHSEIVVVADPRASETQAWVQLPPVTVDTVIAMNGSGESRLAYPANKKTTDAQSLSWQAGSGIITFDADMNKINVNLQMPEFMFKDVHQQITLKNVSTDSSSYKSDSGYRLDNTHIKIGATDFVALPEGDSPLKPAFTVNGLRISDVTTETGNNLNLSFEYGFKDLHVVNQSFGPAQLKLEVRKLDRPTLVAFGKTLGELFKQNLPAEQLGALATGKMIDLLADLAKKSPELEITKFGLTTSDGEIQGKAKLAVDGSNLNVRENPMLLVGALSGEGEISLPGALVETIVKKQVQNEIEALKVSGKLKPAEVEKLTPQKESDIADKVLPQRVQAFAAKFKMVPTDSRFQINASFNHGQLLVNNQPFKMP